MKEVKNRVTKMDRDRARKIKQQKFFLALITLIVLILVAVSFVFSLTDFILILQTRGDLASRRFCIFMINQPLLQSGQGNSNMTGIGTLFIKGKTLSYNLLIGGLGGSNTIQSMHLRGPLSDASPQSAAIFLPSDGSSFDIDLIGSSTIKGSITITQLEKRTILDNPSRFYLLLNTNIYPTGAISDLLDSECR